jgi:tryptophanase
MDLLRMAIPRRVYTQSHIEHVIDTITRVWRQREQIQGLELVYQPPTLRHFTARLRRVGGSACA